MSRDDLEAGMEGGEGGSGEIGDAQLPLILMVVWQNPNATL